VITVSALAGLLSGITAKIASRHVGRRPLLQSAVALTLYITLGAQISGFYLLSLYNVPAILVALYFSLRLATPDSVALTEEAGASPEPRTVGFW
jgi:hypothetical protein